MIGSVSYFVRLTEKQHGIACQSSAVYTVLEESIAKLRVINQINILLLLEEDDAKDKGVSENGALWR